MSSPGMYHKIIPEATPNMKPAKGSRIPLASDQIQLPMEKNKCSTQKKVITARQIQLIKYLF